MTLMVCFVTKPHGNVPVITVQEHFLESIETEDSARGTSQMCFFKAGRWELWQLTWKVRTTIIGKKKKGVEHTGPRVKPWSFIHPISSHSLNLSSHDAASAGFLNVIQSICPFFSAFNHQRKILDRAGKSHLDNETIECLAMGQASRCNKNCTIPNWKKKRGMIPQLLLLGLLL